MKERLKKAFELFDSGKLDEAEKLYLSCLDEAAERGGEDYYSALMGLVYVESFLQKFASARNYAALLIKAARGNEELHVAFHQAGMVERMAKNYSAAADLFNKEAEIISSFSPAKDSALSANFYEQGYIELLQKNLSAAEEKMSLSIEHAQKVEDQMCLGCALRGMGEIKKAAGDLSAAQSCFEKAVAAFTEAGDLTAVREAEEMM